MKLKDKRFQRVDQFKYLGTIITQDNGKNRKFNIDWLQSANRYFYGIEKNL